MIRAFIVKLDVEEVSSLEEVAVDIDNALENHGLPVESVVPWKGHGLMAEAPAPVGPFQPAPPILP